MQAGRLDRQIVIKKATSTQNSYGEQALGWSDLVTLWAQVRPLAGRELFSAQQVRAEIDTEFVLRHTTVVRPDMLISYGGLDYDIHSIIDVGDRQRELRILAGARTT